MTAEGEAEAQSEVDAVRWLGIADAAKLLSYPGDRDLLSAFAALPPRSDLTRRNLRLKLLVGAPGAVLV